MNQRATRSADVRKFFFIQITIFQLNESYWKSFDMELIEFFDVIIHG